MGKYFGTDGIRNKAEKFTPEFIGKIAKGVVDYAGDTNKKVLLGGDTRESSEWILRDFERAFETLGVECGNVGVLPTPGINYAFYDMGFDFAIDVTASHNPYTDNGVKVFERGETSGIKLSDAGVEKIEYALDDINVLSLVEPDLQENLHDDALDRYMQHLLDYTARFDKPDGEHQAVQLDGMRIGLDCANGATSVVAERAFQTLGAETMVINADASYGQKINAGCGSTHLEQIQELVIDNGLDFGVAFDGDGDRCLMIDNEGLVIDGDKIIAILAEYLKLPSVAITVMANQGLIEWANRAMVEVCTTDVGDQNVAKAMREKNILLGGETSGHVILPGETMGDGVLTALVMSKVIKQSGKTLAELASVMHTFPQVVENFEATAEEKARLQGGEAKEVIDAYSERLSGGGGRLLVRPSGTEDLIRITMWGNNQEEINDLAKNLANDLKSILEVE
ncbi:phosphoglucosamine mutase [Candidatus Saccharibacteria bacterium]|nr:phosphoglucosamine mutase [Candidatus Saccharibacteria bacterium]